MRLTADYPPVWLAGFAAAGWVVGRIAPHGPDWQSGPGWALVAAGAVLMAWAAGTMARARTTVIPHEQPSRLVTAGPFAVTRNPIYLADVLVLTGLCLVFGAPLAALPLAAGFVAVISARFIQPEEARLAAAFPEAFAAYRRRVRRWL